MYLASAVGQPSMDGWPTASGPAGCSSPRADRLCRGRHRALAPTFALLIVSRVVLGIGTAAAYPAAMAVLRAESRRTGLPTPRRVLGRSRSPR
ncbi:hypothetical protein O1L68_06710 [Streptomyces lydicus]|nr:hypothetical protein [Streptomyces lydicus]